MRTISKTLIKWLESKKIIFQGDVIMGTKMYSDNDKNILIFVRESTDLAELHKYRVIIQYPNEFERELKSNSAKVVREFVLAHLN